MYTQKHVLFALCYKKHSNIFCKKLYTNSVPIANISQKEPPIYSKVQYMNTGQNNDNKLHNAELFVIQSIYVYVCTLYNVHIVQYIYTSFLVKNNI